MASSLRHSARIIGTLLSRQALAKPLTRCLPAAFVHTQRSQSLVVPQTTLTQQAIRSYSSAHIDVDLPEMTMDVLKLYDKVDPTKLSLEARFKEDLGLDSLDIVEVVMAFEDEFGIEFNDVEAEAILTVQQAIDAIRPKMSARFGGAVTFTN